MLAVAIISLISFVCGYVIFAIFGYGLIYLSLIISYYFDWDDEMRKKICPKGLWHTIFYDVF